MEALSRMAFTFQLNALWQVTLVTALTAIAVRLMQRAPARFQHILWVMGLGLAVLLPFTTLPDSLACRSASLAERRPPEASPPSLRASRAAGSQPAPGINPSLGFRSLAGATSSARRTIGSLLLNPLRHRSRAIPLPPFIAYAALSVYLFALLWQLTRLARAWAVAKALRREACGRGLPEELSRVAANCRAAYRLRSVAILASSQAPGPATVGFLNPVIVMPEALLQTAPYEELPSALCHEMAHVRRRDYLVNLLCEFALLPLAFHPAAWLLKRRIDETRELACDEAAAGVLHSATAYARSLVSLAQSIAPLTSSLRPHYTLGVFDANILEERIMRLLENRPQVSPRRARLLLSGITIALALAAFAAATFSLTAVGIRKVLAIPLPPNDFSGRWELDASKSDLPSPFPANLVEVIDQHGSELKVTTTSTDWNTNKPVAVSLFALMLPEFSATTDNKETIQPFGPGQIRSKTRWEGNDLVTEWTLERNSQSQGKPNLTVAVSGRWVRSLSTDGNTQTIEITAHDPVHNLDGAAKAVFVRREQNPRAFLGTWRGQFEGRTYLLLTLKEAGGSLSGAVSVGAFGIDATGQVVRVKEEANPRDASPISDAKLEGDLLSFNGTSPDGGTVVQFQMRLAGRNAAELLCRVLDPRAGTPAPGWWKLLRESDEHQTVLRGPGPEGGVVGGINGGVAGGVIEGMVQGVPGGVTGGVASGVMGQVAGGVVAGVVGGVPGGATSGVVAGVPGGVTIGVEGGI